MFAAWLAALWVLSAGSAATAEPASRRIAVVVGVGAYQTVPPLANPPRDARAVAAVLRRLGFDTTLVIDPDRAALERAIRTLGDKAASADAALFFFAGHGLEAGGRNFIVPTGAKVSTVRDLPFETVDLDLVGQQVEGRARTVLVFLDACRDNPFAFTLSGGDRGLSPGRGLAAPAADASGTLIAFATAPGRTAQDGDGDDSPFTTALLAHLETPGLEVRQMLGLVRRDVRQATGGKQIPWESSALEGSFYFHPDSPDAPGNGVRGPTDVVTPPDPNDARRPPGPRIADTARSGPTTLADNAARPVSPALPSSPPVSSGAGTAGRAGVGATGRPSPGASPPGPPPASATVTVPPAAPAPPTGAGAPVLSSRAAQQSRCHVRRVTGIRRPGGAETTMQVTSDGRGCGFRIFVKAAERVPFDSLVATLQPANGKLVLNNNQQIIYIPTAGFVGTDHFTVATQPQGSLVVNVAVRRAPPPDQQD